MQPSLFVCYQMTGKATGTSEDRFNVRAIYTDELNALRYAVEHGMKVREIDEGDIIEQLKGEAKPRRKENTNVNRPTAIVREGAGVSSDQAVPATPANNGITREEQLRQAEEEGFNIPPQTGRPAPGDGPARFPDGQDLSSIHYGPGTR